MGSERSRDLCYDTANHEIEFQCVGFSGDFEDHLLLLEARNVLPGASCHVSTRRRWNFAVHAYPQPGEGSRDSEVNRINFRTRGFEWTPFARLRDSPAIPSKVLAEVTDFHLYGWAEGPFGAQNFDECLAPSAGCCRDVGLSPVFLEPEICSR